MGLQRVLWMLVLTFSTCWKVKVKIAGESAASWTDQHKALSYHETIMETPYHSLPLPTPGGYQTPPMNSSANNIYASEDHLISSAAAVNAAEDNIPKELEMQREFISLLRHQKPGRVSMLSADEVSLSRMLLTVVEEQFSQCDLILAHSYYNVQAVLQELLLLQNPRQVVHMNTTEDLSGIIWTSSACRGYIILVDKPEPLLSFASTFQDKWDYSGRFVIVGLSLQNLEAFINSYVGGRTEHVVGAVKSGTEGEWLLYMNQLYWGQGVRRIDSWYNRKFTRYADLFPNKLADFQGAVIKVSTFHYVPINFLQRSENGTVIFRYGMDIEMVRSIAQVLNFTIEFMETPNGIVMSSEPFVIFAISNASNS